jgi:hypothetical protein
MCIVELTKRSTSCEYGYDYIVRVNGRRTDAAPGSVEGAITGFALAGMREAFHAVPCILDLDLGSL